MEGDLTWGGEVTLQYTDGARELGAGGWMEGDHGGAWGHL